MKQAAILFILSIVASVVLLNPTVKKKTMALLLNDQKEVLSQLELVQEGRTFKIIKVQDEKGLGVELYKTEGDSLVFLDSHQLTDKKDAFYKFNESKHNLFAKDINGDGVEELILPSLDKNMKARLNVFRLDLVNERLQKITNH